MPFWQLDGGAASRPVENAALIACAALARLYALTSSGLLIILLILGVIRAMSKDAPGGAGQSDAGALHFSSCRALFPQPHPSGGYPSMIQPQDVASLLQTFETDSVAKPKRAGN